MRFTTAWSDVLSQNITLRAVIFTLSICLGIVCILAVKMGFQEPIIIERSCYSKAVSKASPQHTKDETETFLKIALAQRFDSDSTPSVEMISADELSFKKQESQDLTSKNMIQKIVVNSVQTNGSEMKIDADRLISVGKIRSALSFPLVVTVTTAPRTEGNPYGLMLLRVSQSKEKERDQ